VLRRATLGGITTGATGGLTFGLAGGPAFGAVTALLLGGSVAIAALLLSGLRDVWLTELRDLPASARRAAVPDTSRYLFIATALAIGVPGGACDGLMAGLSVGHEAGLPEGLVAGLRSGLVLAAGLGGSAGVLALGLTPPSCGLLLRRVEWALAATGRGRVQFVTLLEDAAQRRVLRPADTGYQFRDSLLAEHLSGLRTRAPAGPRAATSTAHVNLRTPTSAPIERTQANSSCAWP
jgi:hypothetical protein